MMNRFKFVLLSFILLGVFSCSDDDDDLVGNWIRRSDFGGPVRGYASIFVIGRRAYVVGGNSTSSIKLTDIWEFNIDQSYWTQKANFPGVGRQYAFAFASEEKGYYGTGYDGSNHLSDFWEFDPDNNQWTQKADFPGGARSGVTAFYLNGIGYAGTGFNSNYFLDFYKFDPSTSTWETGVSIQGTKRTYATNFVINNRAYVLGGENNGAFPTDVWMFDPDTQTWEQKTQIGDKTDYDFDDEYTTIARRYTASFVINGLGYISTGDTNGLNSYTWEYNPSNDRWTERTSFEGTARTGAVGFSIDNRGFVLTGVGSTSSTSLIFDDMWEFKPRDEYNEYD